MGSGGHFHFSFISSIVFFGPASNASASINYGEEVSEVAKRYVGTPYKAGGTTPKGFDAIGFTQYVYKTQQQR